MQMEQETLEKENIETEREQLLMQIREQKE
jgi:hypothetical protein